MDWAVISQTIERLQTLDQDELTRELDEIKASDPDLAGQIDQLVGRRKDAASFMQTSMPDGWDEPAQALPDGSQIGVWQIRELLGAGGMGEVYRAERADGLFEQQAALKIAKTKTKAFRDRFDAERQRLAQLEHPNIARIIDGGSSDKGAPYMTMEFVDGQPINTYAKEHRLGRAQRLALISKLCSALSHAHGRLVLHRDIKHDNVLINADGEVRLIDFGVASLLDDASTQEGRGPLTIAYAAPEQLEGRAVSAATDIFAVGMLAHLLETGSLPKRQGDGGVAIDAGRIGDADLSAILAKATAKDPQDRYGSVDALGDDMEKLLGGFAVAARPVSSVTRFKKLVARNKLASAMGTAAAVALVAGVVGVSVFAVRANEARAEAEERLEWAEYSLEETNLEADKFDAQRTLFSRFVSDIAGVDEAELRQFLIRSAEDAKRNYDENPEGSSAIVYSVAQYLVVRGDYETAAQLDQFIIEHEGTPEISVQGSKLNRARSLRELGKTEQAVQLYGEVLRWMQAKPFLKKTEGYASIATNYALSTLKPEDLEEAIRASFIQAEDPNHDENVRAYHFNNLHVLAGRQIDFDKAIEFGIKAVELTKNAEEINFVSANTRSLNLVEAILRMKQDIAQAKKYLPPKDEVMNPNRGHLRHRAMYYEITALIAQIKGDHRKAFADIQTAIEMAKDDYPPEAPFRLALSGMAVETAAMSGDLDGAENFIEDAMVPVAGTQGKPHVRGYMAQVFLLNAQGKRKAALKAYDALDHAKIETEYKLIYKRDLLRKALGLKPLS